MSRAEGAWSLVVVTAGLGRPSATRLLADRLALSTERALTSSGHEVTVEIVELRDHAQDLVNNLLTGFPGERLRGVVERAVAADGLVAVTPIYNASFSGLFKLFFDVLERDSLAGTPVLIGATGGTKRHSLALDYAVRPLFAYLGAAVVPTAVYAAAGDWGGGDDDRLTERIERAGRELADAVAARPSRRRADPFEDPVPFAELLADTGRSADVRPPGDD